MTILLTSFVRPIYLSSTLSKFHVSVIYFNNVNKLISRKFRTDWEQKLDKIKNNIIGNNCTPDLDKSKVRFISKLNFECKEHAIPFYKLSPRTLLQIYKCTKHDERMDFCKNRLYYISSRLKCPPELLSDSLAKRSFIYNLSFDWLESSLNVLLDMGVSAERILRDLWVLKYHHKTIYERLLRVKNLGIKNLYPWMVRCTEHILDRYIEISQETKSILGENQSTQTYLAKRLKISTDDVEEIYLKIPALKTIRVTKVKSFLDYLINEGFEIEDIARKPRVLTASQKTVKQRLDMLRGLGLKEINLNILSRSRKEFHKYYTSLESVSEQKI